MTTPSFSVLSGFGEEGSSSVNGDGGSEVDVLTLLVLFVWTCSEGDLERLSLLVSLWDCGKSLRAIESATSIKGCGLGGDPGITPVASSYIFEITVDPGVFPGLYESDVCSMDIDSGRELFSENGNAGSGSRPYNLVEQDFICSTAEP